MIIQELLTLKNKETEVTILLKQFKDLETQYKGAFNGLILCWKVKLTSLT